MTKQKSLRNIFNYLQLKYCRRQFSLLTPIGPNKSFTIKNQQQIARFLTCFGLKLLVKGGLNNLIFRLAFKSLFSQAKCAPMVLK